MTRRLFSKISPLLPFSAWTRMVRSKVVAPFYHIISDRLPLHVKHLYPVVSAGRFEHDIDFMLKHFVPIMASDIPKVLNRELILPKPALFLSFDDGFREMKEIVAPMLQKKGVPATFFITPSFTGNNALLYRCKQSLIAEKVLQTGESFTPPDICLEQWGSGATNTNFFLKHLFNLGINQVFLIDSIAEFLGVDFADYLKREKPYLSLEDIKELAEMGFAIGAHSMNHPLFGDISLENQIQEVKKSVEWVKENVANQPKLFAFPYTDAGVSRELYRHFLVDNSDEIDTFFGTSGLKPTSSIRMLHRIPMEIKGMGARHVLGGEFFYYFAKSFVGKHKVKLPK